MAFLTLYCATLPLSLSLTHSHTNRETHKLSLSLSPSSKMKIVCCLPEAVHDIVFSYPFWGKKRKRKRAAPKYFIGKIASGRIQQFIDHAITGFSITDVRMRFSVTCVQLLCFVIMTHLSTRM